MNKVTIFNENVKIGGYILPTDFAIIDRKLLNDLYNLDFYEGYKRVYELISGRLLTESSFNNLQGLDMPLSVVTFDNNISSLELFDGKNANYNDYILDSSDLFGKICSVVSFLALAYVDLEVSNIIKRGESINIACPSEDFILPLSIFIAKKCGLPIETSIYGSLKNIDIIEKYTYFSKITEDEENELISLFFDDYGYLFDPLSARGFIAQDNFYEDYEDGKHTLILSLVSPYKYSRRIYKVLTGKNELSVEKAIKGVYNLTAMEIPNGMLEGEISPFFAVSDSELEKEVFNLLKNANKV